MPHTLRRNPQDDRTTRYARFRQGAVFTRQPNSNIVAAAGSSGHRLSASVGAPTGRLRAIADDSIKCGADGSLGNDAPNLFEHQKGSLWVDVSSGLWRWTPGDREFYAGPDQPEGIRPVGEDEDGALLVGLRSGIRRFGRTQSRHHRVVVMPVLPAAAP